MVTRLIAALKARLRRASDDRAEEAEPASVEPRSDVATDEADRTTIKDSELPNDNYPLW